MKKILIVAGISLVALLVLAVLDIIDIKAVWAALTMIVVGGGGALSTSLKNKVDEQQEQIKKDGEQAIQEIKDRPVEEDIKTLSPDTKASVDEVKASTVQNIMKRIKQRG